MGIKEYLDRKKQSGDFKSKKGNDTVETIKRMVATGLLTATILAGGVSTTGCESVKSNMTYEEALSAVDSKLENFDKEFEYDSIVVGVDQNKKYVIMFMNSESFKNVSFSISKKEYEKILSIAEAIDNEAIISSPDGSSFVIEDDSFEDQDLKELLNSIYATAANKKPFGYDAEVNTDDNQNTDNYKTGVEAIDGWAKKMGDLLVSLGKNSFEGFDVDEIVFAKIDWDKKSELEEETKEKQGNVVVVDNGKDFKMGTTGACVLIDYYDSDADGKNDRYRIIPLILEDEQYNDVISVLENSIDGQNIKLTNGRYIVTKDCLNNPEYSTLDKAIKDALSSNMTGCFVSNSKDFPYKEESEMTK